MEEHDKQITSRDKRIDAANPKAKVFKKTQQEEEKI